MWDFNPNELSGFGRSATSTRQIVRKRTAELHLVRVPVTISRQDLPQGPENAYDGRVISSDFRDRTVTVFTTERIPLDQSVIMRIGARDPMIITARPISVVRYIQTPPYLTSQYFQFRVEFQFTATTEAAKDFLKHYIQQFRARFCT